ncbi:MAG: hypothetical protein ACOC3J_00505 [Gemmatimonadota bacterium]
MADDFEGTINLDQMDDDDIGELVRQRLDEDAGFNVDTVEVEVRRGLVKVEGRVGTEGERQHVEQVLTALGATDYENNVVVDENTRAQRADAADDALVEDQAAPAPLGESGTATSDTAEHLQRNEAEELYGTRDPKKAIEEGKSYTPPEGPTQEGIGGDEQH